MNPFGFLHSFDRLPKVISPRGHAILDYFLLAGTVAGAIQLMRRNKIAGFSALATAALEATNLAMTDFPGGIFKLNSFPMHGRIGLGIVALVTSMPNTMGFTRTRESRYFYVYALIALGIIAMTDFEGTGGPQLDLIRQAEA